MSTKARQQAEEELDPTVSYPTSCVTHPTVVLQAYLKNRTQAVLAYEAAGHNPYPHKWHVDMSVPQFRENFANVPAGERLEEVTVSIAGALCFVCCEG